MELLVILFVGAGLWWAIYPDVSLALHLAKYRRLLREREEARHDWQKMYVPYTNWKGYECRKCHSRCEYAHCLGEQPDCSGTI